MEVAPVADVVDIAPASNGASNDVFGDASPVAADFTAPPPGMGSATDVLSAAAVGAPPPP